MTATAQPASNDRDAFPRLHARTQRFTLGRPRGFAVAPDGDRVWFVCSDAGDDPVHHLWLHDATAASTDKVVDVRTLAVDDRELTPAEQARRERAREGGGGIVSFATDRAARLATFVLAGQAFVADLAGTVVAVQAPGGAFDPRLSPDGTRVAMVVDGAVHVGVVATDDDGLLTPDSEVTTAVAVREDPGSDAVTWGLAEFVAAEEMRRGRGFWWAPDGQELLVARVDESQVAVAWLADPIDQTVQPRPHRYPFAGTTNATVDLHLVALHPTDDGAGLSADAPRAVTGDRDHYLADVSWSPDQPALVTWQDRGQQATTITTLDRDAARCEILHVRRGQPWTELVAGTPTWLGQRLVTVDAVADLGDEGTHALHVDGTPVSPAGLQVRSVVDASDDEVVVTCSRGDATTVEVVAVDVTTGAVRDVVAGHGVAGAHVGGPTRVEVRATMTTPTTASVVRDGERTPLPDNAADLPDDQPEVVLHETVDGLRAGVVVPAGDGPFPVLLDPYGGPHAQRVVQSRTAWLAPQWFARQGFAVVVIDNRGAPGRSPAFEHAVAGDLASPALHDQFAALDALAAADPRLDTTRTAIRGWSFGGYLAALAALRRPDRVRAAVVGAPVTVMGLYDTHYTERYLGHPDQAPDAYAHSSLVGDDGSLVDAAPTDDPPAMLLIHGLADDNVLAAHTMRLSRALLEAGRPHRVLPLSGVTHMTPQEVVAANLLHQQLAFLREALDMADA